MESINPKVVIITGASSGIGKCTKELLRSKGHIVYNFDIQKDPVNENDYFILCNMRKRDEIKSAISMVIEKEGHIDWLFANAGVHLFASIENTSDDDFDRVTEINILGSFYSAKYVLPYMKARKKGSILFMGSDQSFSGKGHSSVYGLTKGAIGQLTKSTAIDYAPYNIRVNCICPGTIDTPLLDRAAERYSELFHEPMDVVRHRFDSVQPMGRVGKPEEIAKAAAFILSDENSFMTGSLVSVDGGYTCQ